MGQLAVHPLPARRLHGRAVRLLSIRRSSRRRVGRRLAGLNYFLTHGARGGEGTKLLGEKRDVRVWLSWLERYAHGDVEGIETPIGFIPRYEDLAALFRDLIAKDYPRDLYERQFSFYVDNILARIALQEEAYRKEKKVPARIFEVYAEQRRGLEALKAAFGPVVPPARLAGG